MFITRSSLDIYNDIGNKLVNETSLTKSKSPGAKARALVTAFSNELGSAYSTLNYGMMMTLISTAGGIFLDYLGELFNVKRIRSAGARISAGHKIFKFYTLDGSTFGSINGGNSFTLTLGTSLTSLLSGNKQVRYELDDDYMCDKDAVEVWVGARSADIGNKVNVGAGVIRNHSFTAYTEVDSDLLQITNMSAIVSGSDTESDDAFRYRIIKQATAGEKANETSIRLALLSLPGVSNIYIDNYGYGIGTFVVYIKPVVLSAGNDLLEQCEIQVDSVVARGVVPLITYLKRLGIELEASITFTPNTTSLLKTQLLSTIKLNLMDYLANLDKDQPYIVNEAVQRVMQTSGNILNVGVANKPFDKMWVWKDTFVEDSRFRQVLRSDLQPSYDEIITYEYSIDNPIRVIEKV